MRSVLIWIAVFALSASATIESHAQTVMPPDVKARKTDYGVVFTDARGMTLYTFDIDKGSGKSLCVGPCASLFPPLSASPGAPPRLGEWSEVARDDGSRQWAYQGNPVYTYSGDKESGDENGAAYIPSAFAIANDPIDRMWHVAWEALPLRPGISIKTVTGGRVLVNEVGMTLYTSDRDTEANKSSCAGSCLEKWAPAPAPALAASKGDWTVIERNDGTTQWAFKGKPLYTATADIRPGDLNGDGLDGAWHAAMIEPLPAPPPGVTVQSSDIGPIFADANGLTLYAWFQAADRLKVTCGDDCMKIYWRPAPAAAPVRSTSGWGVVARPDGTQQLAFGGQPLYTFAKDHKAGDIWGYNFGYPPTQQAGAWQPVRPAF